MWLKEVVVLIISLSIITGQVNENWWKTTTFYQIYPRSFKDSNNDGIGDLQGIISKLDYLKNTGITATWLSPIFKSPQVDQGYDISDYYDVDPDYGTLEDLEELIKKATELGIKIILDYVPNHTSDQHDWFNKSANREKGYEDFYVWADGKEDPENPGQFLPPNNWISVFSNSAWTWNENRQQFYLHQFASAQPDLNYRNPAVIKAMEDVFVFWLDKGVAGFRVDAVSFLFEDAKLTDEPESGDPDATDQDYEFLKHIYTKNQQENYDLVYEWREFLDKYSAEKGGDARIIMTEGIGTNAEVFLYYGSQDLTRIGAHFSFNFDFIYILTNTTTVEELETLIISWYTELPDPFIQNWVLGNHDNHRTGSRIGERHIDSLNILASILPGVQVTYNGEEIGMLNGKVTCEEGQDPGAIKNCTTYDQTTRDFERTPFHWDDSVNAGFNEGTKPWLPVSELYKVTNLAAQNVPGLVSYYNNYKKLLEIRKTIPLEAGYQSIKRGDQVIEIIRSVSQQCPDALEYHFLYNLNQLKDETVDIWDVKDYIYEVVVASVESQYKPGDIVTGTDITLQPSNGVLLKATCAN